MHDHNPETEDTDREEKDAYDEFEEGVSRVGVFILSIIKELKISERIGHGIALATLTALIFYTGYTIKIYKATNRTAIAAQRSADIETARKRPWVGIVDITKIGDEEFLSADLVTRLDFSVIVKNYGGSLAQGMVINTIGMVGKHIVGHWKEFRACEDVRNDYGDSLTRIMQPAPRIAFPGQQEFDAGPAYVLIQNGAQSPTRWVIACLVYHEVSGEVHHTQALYQTIPADKRIPIPEAPNLSYFPTDHFLLRDSEAD